MNQVYVRLIVRVSQALSALVLAIVVMVFAGYALEAPILISIAPSLQGMSVLTALALGCIALALLAGNALDGRLGLASSWLALAVSMAVLASHAIAGRDVLSPNIARVLFSTDPAHAGKTSIATALGVALLAFAQLRRLKDHPVSADLLASASLLLSGTALLGYAYGVRQLYALYLFNTMAVHTAAAIFALALATSFAQATNGWASALASSRSGGGATRRQMLFTVVPPIAGGVLLHAAEANQLGPAVAMALLVMLTIAPLIVLILHDGRVLDTLDIEREAADRLRERSDVNLKSQLADQALALNHESMQRAKAEATMQAAQRLETVGQLTGGIAHDFNNLLMAIASNLHLTQAHISPGHPARSFIDNAASATQRGARLTGQLLAFSRTQRLDLRTIALDDIVTASRELFVHALGPRVDIQLDLAAPLVSVRADPDQLQLAILNLALNARDAMPSGGLLRIETVDTVSHPAADPPKYFAAIRVIDNGHGMTHEVVQRAVEPFFTTKERGKGTGLGLAQVYGVVKQCGGELEIRSEVGVGTTIEIWLPRVDAQSLIAPAEPMPAQRWHDAASIGTLLVIDDDDLVRNALAEMFRSAGYEVAEAEDGAVGLKLLEELKPSVAVIDFLMPGLNGAEVARLARAKLPHLPIIFVSGYSDTLALDEISNAVVLRKPVGPDALLDAVAMAMQ